MRFPIAGVIQSHQCYSYQSTRILEILLCQVLHYKYSHFSQRKWLFQSLLIWHHCVWKLSSKLLSYLWHFPYPYLRTWSPTCVSSACDPDKSFKSSLRMATAILLQPNLMFVIFYLHYCNNLIIDLWAFSSFFHFVPPLTPKIFHQDHRAHYLFSLH